METYYKIPSKVEAIRLTEDNLEEVAEWCGGAIKGTKLTRDLQVVEVWNARTETEVVACIGDWLVKDSATGFELYDDEDFKSVFEEGDFLKASQDLFKRDIAWLKMERDEAIAEVRRLNEELEHYDSHR